MGDVTGERPIPVVPQPADGMTLIEAEIRAAVEFAGMEASFDDVPYLDVKIDTELVIWFEREGTNEVTALRIKVRSFVASNVSLEGLEAQGSKFFEANVLRRSGSTDEIPPADKAMYGIMFPDNTASIVDSDPDSDYTNRLIMAMLAYHEALEE